MYQYSTNYLDLKLYWDARSFDNSYDNYNLSQILVTIVPIFSTCDPFLALGRMKKSAKYNHEGLVHQNKDNVATTCIFKIIVEFWKCQL